MPGSFDLCGAGALPEGLWALLGDIGPAVNNCNTITAGVSYDLQVTIKCANGPIATGITLNFGGVEFVYETDGVYNEVGVVALTDCLLTFEKTDDGWEGGIEVIATLT